MTDMPDLTAPQLKALQLVYAAPARYSNKTDPKLPSVYWQAADALEKRGLVNISTGDGDRMVHATITGRITVERLKTKQK